MKITKQKLKQIIREELAAEGSREDMMMPAISMADMDAAMADDASLGDLQSDEKFTGGSPEERLLTLIKARELLAAMGKEELTALSKSLDAEQVAVLRHILANPMYAPMEEYRSTGTGGQSKKDREKPARPSSDTSRDRNKSRGGGYY